MSLSLYNIEEALLQLDSERARAVDEGDQPAVEAINAAIGEYLTAEATKVTSYVGLIRSREATVAAAKAERDRIDAILKAAEADVERLKANALAVMQRFDIKELKATPGGGLRRQGNGGVEPLDIPNWPKDASGGWKPLPIADAPQVYLKNFALPDTDRIRAALKTGEKMVGSANVRLLERGEHVRVI